MVKHSSIRLVRYLVVIVIVVLVVVGMLNHFAEDGAHAGVLIAVCRIVAEVRIGKCAKVVWRAQLGHRVALRSYQG
jgi:hypothetical protein